ncbi:MAG: protein kinase, partial [Gemmatimonadaceae bacterium]
LSGRHALIVDFGVAKALSEAADEHALTTIGITLGTPLYMAPEQASADPDIDHRADIYALGIVAYEMLSGLPPFTGMSPHQVIRAHVTKAPEPLGTHLPNLSADLESVVMRCLAKDPADRYQTAEQVYAALEPFAATSGATTGFQARRPSHTRSIAIAAGGVLVVVAAFAAWSATRGKDRALTIGKASQLTTDEGLEIQPSISPDGKFVAYAAGNSQRMRIFIRPVAGGRTVALSDDSSSVEIQPHWSPDGSHLLFLSRNAAYVSPALGGSEKLVTPGTTDNPVTSATWTHGESEIIVARHDSVFVQSLEGGSTRVVGTGTSLHSCSASIDRTWIACVTGNPNALVPGFSFGNLAPSDIVVFPFGGGAGTTITDGRQSYQSPVWAARGNTLYVVSNRDGPRDVYAIEVGRDGRTGAITRATTGLNAQSISLSGDEGALAYSLYTAKANIWSLPIPEGSVVSADAATAVTSGSQVIELLIISPDRAALIYDSDISGHVDIYRVPVRGGTPEVLVHDSLATFSGDLSPDGREIAYHAFGTDRRRRFYVRDLATNIATRVADTDMQETSPRWSPDGLALSGWDQRTSKGGPFVIRRSA